jgi:serine/threonine-protein kinase
MTKISPEDWQRLKPILHEAMDLAPAERAGYLDRTCADRPGLRLHVESLLAADDEAGDFLVESPHDRLADVIAEDSPHDVPGDRLAAGERLGPYRVLRELGRGGMGVVYLAERLDGHPSQTVALKLIKRGMDTDAVRQRFRRERRILARLEHPAIARLLDGGLTTNGQPWFAMEYVDGVSITAYCGARSLGVPERLRLFEDVCDAVQCAHRNLVVHRDLKPSHILVTPDGRPKLLDFGIAKMLGDDADQGESMDVSILFAVPLTPEYAAPEQVQGTPVTTATDVYALGAVLYELLTDRKVHAPRSESPEELVRAICFDVPVRPSDALGKSRGLVSPDLDRVVLRALEKAPERRYPSAEALLADLRRLRAGLPVHARGDSLADRLRRLVRRDS